MRSWKRRWFILKGDSLYYFSSPQAEEPNGAIALESAFCQVKVERSALRKMIEFHHHCNYYYYYCYCYCCYNLLITFDLIVWLPVSIGLRRAHAQSQQLRHLPSESTHVLPCGREPRRNAVVDGRNQCENRAPRRGAGRCARIRIIKFKNFFVPVNGISRFAF